MIYEKIKDLCKKNGISVNELEQKIGVAKGSLCKIDKHEPGTKKIQAIALELHCKPEYLIENESISNSVKAQIDDKITLQPHNIKEYMLKFANLPEDKRNQIMSLIDMLEDK